MRILKFGGSSVATAERITRVAEIVRAAGAEERIAVVVSALGGVTDALVAAAGAAQHRAEDLEDRLDELEQRHLETARAVADPAELGEVEAHIRAVLAQLRDFLRGVGLVGEVSPRSLDRIVACGEQLSAPIVAAAARHGGVAAVALDARELIVTDSTYGQARPDAEATRRSVERRFAELRAAGSVPIVTGFIAATDAGETTTLGRGGSDFTASILAVALGASALELWTDVDGVMSADPRLVPAARSIRRLRYDELMELSHFGAKVVHPPSVHPVRSAGIPLWIKSTFEPDAAGTLVSDEADAEPSDAVSASPIRGITSIRRVAMARLEGDGMVGVSGVAMRLFGALAGRGVSVILITQASSEHSICFAVAPADLEAARQAVDAEFATDRRAGDIDELDIEDDVSVVAVVGAAMRQHPGIAGRLFSILGRRGVNVRAIAQGSSELNISLVVRMDDEAPAVRAIHQAFFEGDDPSASVFLAGVGGVGGALLGQLEAVGNLDPASRRSNRATLRLEGVANSAGALLDAGGIEPAEARGRLASSSEAPGASALVEAAIASPSPDRVFVDCTAADGMEASYERLLAAGVAVVTANKKPLAAEAAVFERLLAGSGARLYAEATVGAGLPVVRTLADLVATGDRLARVEGVFSGTASYLAGELARGIRFSEAVRSARELGYTEPDPRDDLAGEDVARKLLILLRLAGIEPPSRPARALFERADLEVEPWIPAEPWASMEREEFMERLAELDPAFERRQAAAAQSGARLAYVGSWDGSAARAALVEVDPKHPCFDLEPGENLIAFTTRRYAKMPLVVRGPGAGPEVTAAGVFADIQRAISERG